MPTSSTRLLCSSRERYLPITPHRQHCCSAITQHAAVPRLSAHRLCVLGRAPGPRGLQEERRSAVQLDTERETSTIPLSAMLEVSEPPHPEGLSSETNLGTTTTACKKVQCSSGPLDSAEFWSRNDKVLCQIDFLEGSSQDRCTKICFVNLEQCDVTQKDNGWAQTLASISPSLPELVLSEKAQRLQESEIMLLSNLQSPKASTSQQSQPAASVCLLRCARSCQGDSAAREINRFLTALGSGRELQSRGDPLGQQTEEDAELSVSSVDDDFLSASEHLGENNEGDTLQADVASGNITDTLQGGPGSLELTNSQQPCQRTPRDNYSCVRDQGAVPCAVTPDLLVPSLSEITLPKEGHEMAPGSQPYSFKLPKIIIMQSTDSDDGTGDHPGSPTLKAPGPRPPLLKARGERQDFSLFSALCGAAQVAGAVALADLAKADDAAGAEAFRANIARVLLGEASAILCQRDDGRSVADLLRSGGGGGGQANDAILGSDVRCSGGRRKVDRFTRAVADSIWEQAAKRAAVKTGGESGDAPSVQDALLESMNAILFDVLCVTAKKISDTSVHSAGVSVGRGSEKTSPGL
ncbi:hypothetical protein COCON_G00088570 [Conger conger]|uniref:A-kinase anchor protein 11 n=1 Tax=Conger conger TaxID=82655 RepID=A0A9Q1DKJ3_CONCO|nr:hypothetical protein COCON_G00088570 [Conger conger]